MRGTTKAVVKPVLESFSAATCFSRDRASAYATAAAECEKIQVADRFHLIKNAHQAVQAALMTILPATIFLRNGNGSATGPSCIHGAKSGRRTDLPRSTHSQESTKISPHLEAAGVSRSRSAQCGDCTDCGNPPQGGSTITPIGCEHLRHRRGEDPRSDPAGQQHPEPSGRPLVENPRGNAFWPPSLHLTMAQRDTYAGL